MYFAHSAQLRHVRRGERGTADALRLGRLVCSTANEAIDQPRGMYRGYRHRVPRRSTHLQQLQLHLVTTSNRSVSYGSHAGTRGHADTDAEAIKMTAQARQKRVYADAGGLSIVHTRPPLWDLIFLFDTRVRRQVTRHMVVPCAHAVLCICSKGREQLGVPSF